MKIYLENYNINTCFISSLSILDKYKTHQKLRNEIYSDEGIYYVNDSNLCKCIIYDNVVKTIPNYFKKYSALIDNSKIAYIEAYQIPYNHIKLYTCEFYYSTSPSSKIQLVIKCKYEDNQDELNKKENYLTFMDFYFEIPDTMDIHDKIIKKEIIELLSLLK